MFDKIFGKPQEFVPPIEGEEHFFSLAQLDDIFRSIMAEVLVGIGKVIYKFKFEAITEGLKFHTQVSAGFSTLPVDIDVTLMNDGGNLRIDYLNVTVGLVGDKQKIKIEDGLSNFGSFIVKYFEINYKKSVSGMHLTDRGLVVRF